jgi:hypothetical protein
MSTTTVPEVQQEGYFPHWRLRTTGMIKPEERLLSILGEAQDGWPARNRSQPSLLAAIQRQLGVMSVV